MGREFYGVPRVGQFWLLWDRQLSCSGSLPVRPHSWEKDHMGRQTPRLSREPAMPFTSQYKQVPSFEKKTCGMRETDWDIKTKQSILEYTEWYWSRNKEKFLKFCLVFSKRVEKIIKPKNKDNITWRDNNQKTKKQYFQIKCDYQIETSIERIKDKV